MASAITLLQDDGEKQGGWEQQCLSIASTALPATDNTPTVCPGPAWLPGQGGRGQKSLDGLLGGDPAVL